MLQKSGDFNHRKDGAKNLVNSGVRTTISTGIKFVFSNKLFFKHYDSGANPELEIWNTPPLTWRAGVFPSLTVGWFSPFWGSSTGSPVNGTCWCPGILQYHPSSMASAKDFPHKEWDDPRLHKDLHDQEGHAVFLHPKWGKNDISQHDEIWIWCFGNVHVQAVQRYRYWRTMEIDRKKGTCKQCKRFSKLCIHFIACCSQKSEALPWTPRLKSINQQKPNRNLHGKNRMPESVWSEWGKKPPEDTGGQFMANGSTRWLRIGIAA